ncbi:MAG TPA: ABC transporter ATP-binding protein [Polyangiaceae bacterium]
MRKVASPPIVRRGSIIAALAFIERLLTPAFAWSLFGQAVTTKLLFTVALAATFTFRTFTQGALTARTEADLFRRVTSAVLGGDVLQNNVLPEEDARTELLQGIRRSTLQIGQELPVLVADVAASGVLAILVSVIEPGRLVLAAALLALMAGAALAWTRGRLHRLSELAWKRQEPVIASLVDALEGRLEIVASGRRLGFLSEAAAYADAWASASTRVAVSSVIAGRLPMLAIAVVVALLIAAGARRSGYMPIIGLADLALFASVTPAFVGVAQGLQSMVRAERWVAVVTGVLAQAPRSPDSPRIGAPPSEHLAQISLEEVSFRYEGTSRDALALREVTLHWDRPIVALAGANGSGKSTCLRLLMGLGFPLAGRVTIGGTALSDLDPEEWRRKTAFLPQRPYLPFRSDVRSAIRFLAAGASDERMRDSLRRVGMLSALARLGPELDVRVDALSVGQRQRVALARLLCRDAKIWVLDEPDANLDRDGIALVIRLVRDFASAGGRVMLAAHTEGLLAAADRVILVEEGRLRSGGRTIATSRDPTP